MEPEVETKAEKAAGVRVERHLAWHQIGCVKRYGAESDGMCECEKLAEAAKRRADSASSEHE